VRNLWFYKGKWRYHVTDRYGKRRTETASADEQASHDEMIRRQAEEDAFRSPGMRPRSWIEHASRPYAEVVEQFIDWGKAQGGKLHDGWEAGYAERLKKILAWWKDQLGFRFLGDLDGCLPRTEQALQRLARGENPLTSKTQSMYAGALVTFTKWCVQRGMLEAEPLKGMAPFNKDPQWQRAALPAVDFAKLLEITPHDHRRLLYRVAFYSGLRARELRHVDVADLDVDRGGIRLHKQWTKNRKDGFQPLPADLLAELQSFAKARTAERLYVEHYRGKLRDKWRKKVAAIPLLYLPRHPARIIADDFKAAGIKALGKLDFHSLRTSFISRVAAHGASVKEAMTLARHNSPNLTFNTYARAENDRLAAIVEQISDEVKKAEAADCINLSNRKAAGAENVDLSNESLVGVPRLELGTS